MKYGAVCLSIGEVLRRLLSTQPHSDLVKQINQHLCSGCTVPDDLAIQALEIILMDMQCQVRGYELHAFVLCFVLFLIIKSVSKWLILFKVHS